MQIQKFTQSQVYANPKFPNVEAPRWQGARATRIREYVELGRRRDGGWISRGFLMELAFRPN